MNSANAAQCNGMNYSAIENKGCNSSLSFNISRGTMNYAGSDYNFRTFNLTERIEANTTTRSLIVQQYFNCKTPDYRTKIESNRLVDDTNFTKTKFNAVLNPLMSIAIYDRKYTLQEALARNATSIREFNAAAQTAIDLSISSFTDVNSNKTTKYGWDMRSIPFQDAICNDTSPSACTTTLILRFRQLSESQIIENHEMDKFDYWAALGSYFAVVQFVAWLFTFTWWISEDDILSKKTLADLKNEHALLVNRVNAMRIELDAFKQQPILLKAPLVRLNSNLSGSSGSSRSR